MDNFQIQQFINNLNRHSDSVDVELLETHISWIILDQEFVYKIKKPQKYSFLDFSNLEKENSIVKKS